MSAIKFCAKLRTRAPHLVKNGRERHQRNIFRSDVVRWRVQAAYLHHHALYAIQHRNGPCAGCQQFDFVMSYGSMEDSAAAWAGNVGPGMQVRVADDVLLGVGHMNAPEDRRASCGL